MADEIGSSIVVIPYADAKFPALARFLYWNPNTSQSAPFTIYGHTHPQWQARFLRTEYRSQIAARYLYRNPNTSQSAPFTIFGHTQPQWQASKVSNQYRSLPSARLLYTSSPDTSESSSSVGPADVGSSIQVIAYPETKLPALARYLYEFVGDTSQTNIEVSTHQPWAARLTQQPGYMRAVQQNLRNAASPDTSAAPFPPQEGSEGTGQSRFQTVKSQWVTPLYGLSGEVGSAPVTAQTQPETNPPWIGRQSQRPSYQKAVQVQLRNTDSADDASTIPASPSSPMFVQYMGREYAYPFNLLFGSPDPSSAPVAPAEDSQAQAQKPNRYTPGQYRINPSLRFMGDTSQSAPVSQEAETNTNTVGRYHPGRLTVIPGLLFTGDTSQTNVESETNVSTIGRYHAGQHRVVPGLLFSPDTSQSAPFTVFGDTLPQWRPQLLPNQYWIRQAARLLYTAPDTSESAPVAPPSPRTIGRPSGLVDQAWHTTVVY